MAVLYFSGDHVAFFGGIADNGTSTSFQNVSAPFLATDVVEIEIPDQYIGANGELSPNEVQFARVTVVRDGVRHDFDVNSGSKIKETGGSDIAEAGDTFFTTNDTVGPPGSGSFAGLSVEKMVFSTDSLFVTHQTTEIVRAQGIDLNGDGDTSDAGESGNSNFNASQSYSPPCYAPGTLIETPGGARRVETLQPGDLVTTLDHGPAPVRWTRSAAQALDAVRADERPVLVKAGALGPNLPARDLIVSPQHRIFVGGANQLTPIFAAEAFAPAKALTVLPGIRHMMGRREIRWIHFACDRHEVVRANGCWSESLLLGPMAQRGLTERDRWALDAVLPFAADPDYLNGLPARPCLTAGEVRRSIAERVLSRPVAA
jgi:hypothetical protein